MAFAIMIIHASVRKAIHSNQMANSVHRNARSVVLMAIALSLKFALVIMVMPLQTENVSLFAVRDV